MHHDYVFLISHLGADVSPLIGSMNTHPEISATMNQLIYNTPPDLVYMKAACEQVKPARIYVTTVLQNHTFRCPALYNQAKFLYFMDDPATTMVEMLESYKPDMALNYYAFRLQRIAQISKLTTNAMLVTWKDLHGCGDQLTKFLHLKKPLTVFCGTQREESKKTDLGDKAQAIFDRYFAKIVEVFDPERLAQPSEVQQPS